MGIMTVIGEFLSLKFWFTCATVSLLNSCIIDRFHYLKKKTKKHQTTVIYYIKAFSAQAVILPKVVTRIIISFQK